ncbi:MAG: alpha-N-arabinofuranosidase, partial [Bacteroidales bacterium]|nr:alpha-N-arabinofuranosidase [Bacteroidales bacterium]
ADIIKMANMAQLVNVIAPIFAEEKGMFKQTIYYPLELFSKYMHGTALDVFVSCDTYDTPVFSIGLGELTTQQKNVPYLDVSASCKDNEVIISVVNRHKDQPVKTDIICQTGQFAGPVRVFEVNGPDIKSVNDFGSENVRTVIKPDIQAKGTNLTYSFPPHSLTMLIAKIK